MSMHSKKTPSKPLTERLGIVLHDAVTEFPPTPCPSRRPPSTGPLPLRSREFFRRQAELLEPVPQSKPRDTEPACGSELISRREFHGLCEKLAFKRFD